MNHLSLFSGSGIGTLAAAACGIETVAHAENDPACCYCLERLWPDARLFKDVRDVTAESIRDLGPIDVISGGFPCQDISTAGKGAGIEGKRSGLWTEMARIVREVRPRWVLAENVPALRSRGADRVLADLEEAGYAAWPLVVGAWAVGAPHKRDRVWIVAYRRSDRFGGGEQRKQSVNGSQRPLPRNESPGGGDVLANGSREQWQQRSERDGTGEHGQPGLADAIGNLCGRGGDESERGPEGWTAVGRTGEAVGHAPRNDERRAPIAAVHWEGEPTGGSSGGELDDATRSGCEPGPELRSDGEPRRGREPVGADQRELAYTSGTGREKPASLKSHAATQQSAVERGGLCGEQQGQENVRVRPPMDSGYDERCTLATTVPGVPSNQEWRNNVPVRWPARPGEPQHSWEAPRLVEFGVGDAVDGVARRVLSRANKSLLRMVGNGWCYPLAEMMFRAIVELDADLH